MVEVAALRIEAGAEIEALLAHVGDAALDYFIAPTHQATALMEREVIENTPSGVGGAAGLRGSIAGRVAPPNTKSVEGQVVTAAVHALPVEQGTKPHFPPVAPIVDWVQVKLGITRPQASGVAFLIARKISRDGTKGQFMFKRAFEDNEDQAAKMFERAFDELMKDLGGFSA